MYPEKPPILIIALCMIAIVPNMVIASMDGLSLYIRLGAIGLIVVFFSITAVLLVEYAVYLWLDARHEIKRQNCLTPLSEALLIASRLTPEQAAAVNHRGGPAEIAIMDTTEGVAFSLVTHTGLVPLEWIEDFIRHSSYADKLQPVGSYSDKTPGRAFAVSFTDWLVSRKFAVPASGSAPARWMTDQSRAQVIELLGLEVDV